GGFAVRPADQREEEGRGLGYKGKITRLIDDWELGLGKGAEPLLEPTFGMTFGELRNDRGGGDELHRMPGHDCFASERHRKMRFADAGWPEQQHVLAIADPTCASKLAHLLGIDGGLRRKVEAREIAHEWEAASFRVISMRRSSLRAISRSHSSTRVSRRFSSCRPASSNKPSSWSRMPVNF